jgi:branched-chain amino acid transport system substrate-binding protein
MSRIPFRSPLASTLTVAAAGVLLVAGCGKEAPKPAAPQTSQPAALEIRVGHVAPLTGGIAHLGKDNENGARLALEEANAAKISIDGKDARFSLVAEDDQEDPKTATTVAQKLIDAKVAGVVGHLNSGTSIPASSVYSAAGIPMVSGSATNPQLTEQGLKGVFRVMGRDDQQGPALANYLAANNKPKVVAVIDDATAYEKGDNKKTDWKAVLTKVRGRNPDAVFYGGMDSTAGPLLRQARELNLKAVFSFGDGGCTDKMKELAGDAAEGMLCSQAGIPPQASSKIFLDAYKARFKTDPILYSPFTYDAMRALIQAMQKANSADPARYLPALQKIEFTGATGRIAFDDKGDRQDPEMSIFTMKGGKLEPIAVIKGGKTLSFAEFVAQAGAAAPPAKAGDPDKK